MLARALTKVSSLEGNIAKAILDLQEKHYQQLANEVEESLEKDFSDTLNGALPRGERDFFGDGEGLGNAQTKIDTLLTRKADRIILRVTGVVIDDLGQKYKVWHILNKGKSPEAIKEKKNIRRRKERRTFANDLVSKDFAGYTDDPQWFTVGDKKFPNTPNIKSRNWLTLMRKNLIKRIKTKYEFEVEVND